MARPKSDATLLTEQNETILTLQHALDMAASDKKGLTLSLQAAETKIQNLEAVIERMRGWQDCAREVMRRQHHPQATAVPEFATLLKGALS